jgi:hypothetical protein
MKREFAVVYDSYEHEYSVIFRDTGDAVYSTYLTGIGDREKALEIVNALNE